MGHSGAVAGSLRIALTLEQCWHRVPGGTASSVLGLVRALQHRPDLDLIGVAAWHRSPAPAPWRPSVPVRQLPVPGTLLYDAWHRLRWPPVERAVGPVDVIHATTFAIPPPTAPLVVSVHDLAFIDHPEFFTVRGLRFFRRGLELARQHATLVVVPSEATRADCVAAGFDPGRVRVVPWGVDAAQASTDDVTAVRRRLGLIRPYALFVGTIEPRKNLRRLVAAFASVAHDLPDLDLVIAGPDGWNEELADIVGAAEEDEPVHQRIRAVGFVSDDELRAVYAGAEVFCYPSLKEGFGLPVLEAMAQGTPVITSAGTSTEEVAGGAAILVDPLDTEDIARALRRVVTSPEERAALSARGRRRAEDLSWSAAAEATEDIYREASEQVP